MLWAGLSETTPSPLLARWNWVAQLLLPNIPSPFPSRYNGPNLVLKYDRAQKRLVNIAVDERSSPYYALRDRQGNAIGVTACDIDGDGREEIYFLNTNNAFSGKGLGHWAFSRFLPSFSQHPLGSGLRDPGFPQATVKGSPRDSPLLASGPHCPSRGTWSVLSRDSTLTFRPILEPE